MSADYDRWLENEIAMVLTFDQPERDRPGSGDDAAETPEEVQRTMVQQAAR